MKKIFKKSMSGLLAFLMCFTALLSAGVTPAFAAAETCTTYSVSYPRDGDANQEFSEESWGHPARTYMNGWTASSTTMMTIHCMDGYDGQVVYCIEPGIPREMGETMSGFGTSLSGIAVDQYAVTDASGVAVFEDVLIGTGYTLEEVDTAIRYVVPDDQTAAIEWNKVTEKSFSNLLEVFMELGYEIEL